LDLDSSCRIIIFYINLGYINFKTLSSGVGYTFQLDKASLHTNSHRSKLLVCKQFDYLDQDNNNLLYKVSLLLIHLYRMYLENMVTLLSLRYYKHSLLDRQWHLWNSQDRTGQIDT
jgi:hypothetical protein